MAEPNKSKSDSSLISPPLDNITQEMIDKLEGVITIQGSYYLQWKVDPDCSKIELRDYCDIRRFGTVEDWNKTFKVQIKYKKLLLYIGYVKVIYYDGTTMYIEGDHG